MISELDELGFSGAENVHATLSDESGDFSATLDHRLLLEHPNCVVVGLIIAFVSSTTRPPP